ncbi:hypothetical protein THAOC_03856, partial [Thalassiosira oceanica]
LAGVDPEEEASEGGTSVEEASAGEGFGGGGFGGGQNVHFNFDGAGFEKMFNNMGGFGRGGGGGGSFGDLMGEFDLGDIFGGGGRKKKGGGAGRRQQQQRRTQESPSHQGGRQKRRTQPSPSHAVHLVFEPKNEAGVVPLGEARYPDSTSKHGWLMLFHHGELDEVTQRLADLATQLSSTLLQKAKHNRNAMTFRVGAVDCSGAKKLEFCRSKLGERTHIPAFATVFNGNTEVVRRALAGVKQLHDHVTDKLLFRVRADKLIEGVSSILQLRGMFLRAPRDRTNIIILLLTDKSRTSPMYASLAYRHRHDGFLVFSESRDTKKELGKDLSVKKKYPQLVALINDEKTVERYEGSLTDSGSISAWLGSLSKKYLKNRKTSARNR